MLNIKPVLFALVSSQVTGCGAAGPSSPPGAPTREPPSIASSETDQRIGALQPAPLGRGDTAALDKAIESHFEATPTRRTYVMTDKPLYQPGETIWFRADLRATRTLLGGPPTGLTMQLLSPRGAIVSQKRVLVQNGVARNDFALAPEIEGGEYTIQLLADDGTRDTKKIVVSTYEPPRLQKSLELLRKAYGEGDPVAAAVEVKRATGEPLAERALTAVVSIDDAERDRLTIKTDRQGKALVRFTLPASIARGDGLLTILAEDGGVTESIQKRIPILVKQMSVELFAEGGELVRGLPGRVYFLAKNPLGKPADVDGRVVDDQGREVATFSSLHNGMGRFELMPQAGRSYQVQITKPAGIEHQVPVPAARDTGCALMAIDDVTGQRDDVRAAVWCTEDRTVAATAVLREKRLGDVSAKVAAGKPTVIAIPVPAGAQGAVRFTLFDDDLAPLAERLIYRGRGHDLAISITPGRPTYAPRDQVELTIATRDLAGKPVEADLSLAVVDDTVLSFSDDKTANLLSRLYLEAEMPGQEVEEPNFYFSADPKAPHAIDLVLGTQGWRRFDWQPVLQPPVPVAIPATTAAEPAVPMAAPEAAPPPAEAPRAGAMPRRPAAPRPMAVRPAEKKVAEARKPQEPPRQEAERARGPAAGGRAMARRRAVRADMEAGAMDDEWGGDEARAADRDAWGWAPVREFPAPTYEAGYDGPRTDFRETIFWSPSVKTGADGTARVQFHLSDAITSFRATAEGVSAGGLPGRGEALVQSKLPVSLAVTMPLEVSAGDTIELPVTLANETTRPYKARISSDFGPAFKVTGGVPGQVELRGGERKSFFAVLKVIGDGKDPEAGRARIGIETANLKDEVARTIRVVPVGFPQELSASGTLEKRAAHAIELAGAMPGTIEASITLYPSPLATMVAGTEAMIREPYGCFEQASSTNYPNIMVLAYLEQHEGADVALVERTMTTLDRGYKLLTGYESPQKGYEWFGGDPGHEALTAYGLMEFADMRKVYGDVDQGMVQRTRRWLMDRRDGKGGYQRNSRALDSFGQASPEVTNGYITWALTEAGETKIPDEIAYQERIARETKDPYLMALAANTLVNVRASSAKAAIDRLKSMQREDGSFSGADHSITRSGGDALLIETTALAAMAMIEAGLAHEPPVRKAIDWLNAHRDGFGSFSSTQATILSLRAMTAYADAARVTQSSGVVSLYINGKKAGEIKFDKGRKDPLVFDDMAALLRPGKNEVELRLDSQNPLPYSMGIAYRTQQPASSAETQVRVGTRLAKDKVPLGEGVRMKVRVENTTDGGIPMTLARVGIPGGLAFQTWQLDELKDKGAIDFFETREREVVLYFRSMAPKAVKEIDIDLLARVPGAYVAPASRAYLYYTDEHKHWV
ncbi:MAG TPA: MG2 domain-containing protein, partial [Haliangium sp.]|nr:MG2 domain-containing protein [Haliangium sp.]